MVSVSLFLVILNLFTLMLTPFPNDILLCFARHIEEVTVIYLKKKALNFYFIFFHKEAVYIKYFHIIKLINFFSFFVQQFNEYYLLLGENKIDFYKKKNLVL